MNFLKWVFSHETPIYAPLIVGLSLGLGLVVSLFMFVAAMLGEVHPTYAVPFVAIVVAAWGYLAMSYKDRNND